MPTVLIRNLRIYSLPSPLTSHLVAPMSAHLPATSRLHASKHSRTYAQRPIPKEDPCMTSHDPTTSTCTHTGRKPKTGPRTKKPIPSADGIKKSMKKSDWVELENSNDLLKPDIIDGVCRHFAVRCTLLVDDVGFWVWWRFCVRIYNVHRWMWRSHSMIIHHSETSVQITYVQASWRSMSMALAWRVMAQNSHST